MHKYTQIKWAAMQRESKERKRDRDVIAFSHSISLIRMQIFVFKFWASSSLIFCVSMRTLSNHFWQHGMYLCTDDLFPNWIFQLCYTNFRFFAYFSFLVFFFSVGLLQLNVCVIVRVSLFTCLTFPHWTWCSIRLSCCCFCCYRRLFSSLDHAIRSPFFVHTFRRFFLLVGGFLHENFVIKLLLVWSYKFAAQFSLECGLVVFG